MSMANDPTPNVHHRKLIKLNYVTFSGFVVKAFDYLSNGIWKTTSVFSTTAKHKWQHDNIFPSLWTNTTDYVYIFKFYVRCNADIIIIIECVFFFHIEIALWQYHPLYVLLLTQTHIHTQLGTQIYVYCLYVH